MRQPSNTDEPTANVAPTHQRVLRLTHRRSVQEVVAITWIIVIALAFLTPALIHGKYLGPYDLLGQSGLTGNAQIQPHNLVDSDEIDEFIPWQTLAWTQVHAGQLPLWNPDSLLGLPLAFNLQTAVFSPTVAIGYLLPLAFAHDATVIARLIIAGLGAYVLARCMKLNIGPALVCATIYELCGGFTVWLGAYESDCMAWAGWVLAASVLIIRQRHRLLSVTMLTLTLLSAYLAGEPQIMAVVFVLLVGFAGTMIISKWRSGERSLARAVATDHCCAILAGTALASPLYLPGIQLGLHSARAAGPPISGLPLYDLTHFAFSSYNGSPTALAQTIGPNNLYVSSLYVGIIGLVLALSAMALFQWRAEIRAFSYVAIGLAIVLFASPLLSAFRHIPLLSVFRLQLVTTGIDLCLAILAGFGAQALFVARGDRAATKWLGIGVAFSVIGISLLGIRLLLNSSHLSATQIAARNASFLWPSIAVVCCAAVFLQRMFSVKRKQEVLHIRNWRRSRRVQLLGLLGLETAFLFTAGTGIASSSTVGLPQNRAISTLQRIVGTSLVGFGSCNESAFPTTGILPDVNLAYGIREFAAYDPIFPASYYASYGNATGTPTTPQLPVGLFCPAITSVALAREYGVSYIVEPPEVAGPSGTTKVADLDGESLFRVPDSARATLTSTRDFGEVHSIVSNSNSWKVDYRAATKSTVVLNVTGVPGWNASVDGQRLKVTAAPNGVGLSTVVPSGSHIVTFTYWPRLFSLGLFLAGLTLLLFAIAAGRVSYPHRFKTS